MTSLLEHAAEQAEFFDPKAQSEQQQKAICKGLEQFFDTLLDRRELRQEFPDELGNLIATLVGNDRLIFAVNAGDGTLVKRISPAWSFGVETDEKLARRRAGAYHAIVGPELAKIEELLKPLSVEFEDTIVVLREGGPSAEESLAFTASVQDRDSNFLFVVDEGHNNHTWIRANVPGVFCEIDLGQRDVQLYVAADPKMFSLPAEAELPRRIATSDVLDLLAPWVLEQKQAAKQKTYASEYRTRNYHPARDLVETFRAVHREYGRRHLSAKAARYDVDLLARKVVSFNPSEWARRALTAIGRLDLVMMLNNRPVEWFAQNAGVYDELLVLEDKGILRLDPLFLGRVAPIVALAKQSTTPLRTPRPQERLGHLHLVSEIKCIADDDERAFKAGSYYRVSTSDQKYETQFQATEQNKKTGGLDTVRRKRQYGHQRISINNRHHFFDDDPEHISYLLSHFAVPDPGDVPTRYPALYSKMEALLTEVEEEFLADNGVQLKRYQKDDLARVLMKDRAVLAHEQGMGKTIEGIAFALAARKKAGRNLPVLFVVPQDLIPQWMAEAKNRYGLEMTRLGGHKGGGRFNEARETGPASGSVKNLIEAKKLAEELRLNPSDQGGLYITHFEALTTGKNHVKVEEPYTVRIETKYRWIKPGWRTDPDTGARRYYPGEEEPYDVEISSANECPCGNELNGDLTCRKCGHTRVIYKLPALGSILATAFKKGVIVVDEGTQIASPKTSNEKTSSGKTKAVAGMRAHYRLVMSGTPIKNFIAQAFWLLWWAIGNKSERFPYAFIGGRASFAEDFSVFEWTLNEETNNWANKREVGETTNPGRLWAQLGSILLRRTKDETGELIVQRKTHVIEVPRGYRQREQEQFWMTHFPTFYIERHPDDPKSKRPEIIESSAPMLGLDVKLNYAAVLPKSDPDWEWTGVPVSNFTPAALKTLETVMALVKQGRRVLIGTDIKAVSGWLGARLAEKGISVATMLDGSGQTIDPPKRAAVVERFQNGEVEIISSTIKAIRLGHNLDKGSAVVFFGLTWDYEEFSQFRDRVHRLTSTLPVDVYVIVPGEKNSSIVGRKLEVITDKAKGAALALDGALPETPEEPVNVAAIVQEMRAKGIEATGREVMEEKVEEAWMNLPQIDDFQIPAGFAEMQAEERIIDWEAANEALAQYLAEKEAAELAAAWEAAEIEDAERTLAWETILDWAYAEDEARNELAEDDEVEPEAVDEVEPEVEEEIVVVEEAAPIVTPPAPIPDLHSTILVPPAPAPDAPAPPSSTLASELRELKALMDEGILDEDEFKAAKAALIAALKAPRPAAITEEPQLSLAV